MIWRSTLVFLTGLTALALPVDSLRAESISLLTAQSSVVDPNSVIDTGQATPNVGGPARSSLQNTPSEQQVNEVKAIQQELQNRGYYNGPIDGIYGPITAEAIRVLRGQEGNQTDLTPRLFVPDSGPDNTSITSEEAASATVTSDAAEDSVTLENQDEDVQVNTAESPTEGISIGDEVSPETGTDTSDAAPSESNTTESNVSDVAPSQQPSPGLGKLLWPGLALIAALGSFGIGFILSNRTKANNTDVGEESPWGLVPDAVPKQEHPETAPYASSNGRTNINGTSPNPPSDLVVQQTPHANDGLSMMSTADDVSTTTRLAKVDVMDELVANLQVTDPAKRRKAIWELGQRGNSSAVQNLVNGMVDADSKEKSLILAALSEIGIRSLKPMNRALAIALQDDNPDVRKNAIRDLTRVYDLVTQISQMLGHATEDEDPEVRRTAEWALGQLNRIREAPKLKSSMNTLEAASQKPSELLPDEMENLKN